MAKAVQYDCWKADLIFGFFVFPGWLFEQIESINEAGVLQEVGDADSRVCIKSQVQVDYFIIA